MQINLHRLPVSLEEGSRRGGGGSWPNSDEPTAGQKVRFQGWTCRDDDLVGGRFMTQSVLADPLLDHLVGGGQQRGMVTHASGAPPL
jgi:hypothetical protein